MMFSLVLANDVFSVLPMCLQIIDKIDVFPSNHFQCDSNSSHKRQTSSFTIVKERGKTVTKMFNLQFGTMLLCFGDVNQQDAIGCMKQTDRDERQIAADQ